MTQKSVDITIRVEEEKLSAIDAIAARMEVDRSSVLDEAMGNYLWLQEYHRAIIEEGIRQADAGMVVPHERVVAKIEALIARGL